MPSLHAQYISEIAGKRIIEDEFGYATYYKLPSSNVVYIEDIYVVPEKRNSNHATFYESQVTAWGLANGCTEVLGSVNTKINNPERSLQVLLKRNYKISHIVNDIIFLIKGI